MLNGFKKLVPVLAVSSCLTMPVIADDDTGFYIGAGLARSDYNTSGANEFDEDSNQAGIRLGYMFNSNIGLDLTLASIDSYNSGNTEVDVGFGAISVIGSYPVTDTIDLYAKLGGAKLTHTEETDGKTTFDDDSTEFVWALGSKYDFGHHNIFLEYNRTESDSVDLNILMLGYLYEFK